MIEKNLIDQKEKLMKTKESYEEMIKELNAVNTEKEAELKNEKREEIKKIRADYEEKIKRINETNEEQDNIFINEIENKKILVKYVIDVLEDSDKLLDDWQKTVKQQSQEIDESNKNLKEYGKIMEVAIESHKTITKQEEAIEQLEQIINNNQDLTNSYKTLAAKDLTKTSFSSLMSIVTKQETQIEALTEYFKNKNEIKEHVMTIEKLMSSFHTTVSNNTDELLSNYHELLEKQSNSISMLRKVVINKDNSGAGLNYEEDGDGHLVSVSPCSCLPTPPSHTGLHVSSVVLDCGVNTSSSYSVQCSDGDCSTNTWPVCQDDTEELIASHDDDTEEFIASQDDILQVVDEVHEVVTEGPQQKSSDDFDFGTEDTIMKNVGIEIKFPRFLFEEKNLKELEEILNSEINDISLAVDYNYMVILVNTTLTEEFIASLDNTTEEFITSHDDTTGDFIASHDEKSEEAENGILQDVNKVYEVVTGGPQKKPSEDFEFGTKDAIMKNEDNNEIETPQGLFSSDILYQYNSYEEEDIKKLYEILNEEEYDIKLSVGL